MKKFIEIFLIILGIFLFIPWHAFRKHDAVSAKDTHDSKTPRGQEQIVIKPLPIVELVVNKIRDDFCATALPEVYKSFYGYYPNLLDKKINYSRLRNSKDRKIIACVKHIEKVMEHTSFSLENVNEKSFDPARNIQHYSAIVKLNRSRNSGYTYLNRSIPITYSVREASTGREININYPKW